MYLFICVLIRSGCVILVLYVIKILSLLLCRILCFLCQEDALYVCLQSNVGIFRLLYLRLVIPCRRLFLADIPCFEM